MIANVVGALVDVTANIQATFNNVNRSCKVILYNEMKDEVRILYAHKEYGWANEGEGNVVAGPIGGSFVVGQGYNERFFWNFPLISIQYRIFSNNHPLKFSSSWMTRL